MDIMAAPALPSRSFPLQSLPPEIRSIIFITVFENAVDITYQVHMSRTGRNSFDSKPINSPANRTIAADYRALRLVDKTTSLESFEAFSKAVRLTFRLVRNPLDDDFEKLEKTLLYTRIARLGFEVKLSRWDSQPGQDAARNLFEVNIIRGSSKVSAAEATGMAVKTETQLGAIDQLIYVGNNADLGVGLTIEAVRTMLTVVREYADNKKY